MTLLERDGDLTREFQAGAEAAALWDLSAEGWLRFDGPDARGYLHRMTSNHIEGLAAGKGLRALFLTSQGKIVGDLRVLRTGPETLDVEVPAAALPRTKLKLGIAILNSKLTLSDETERRALLSVHGPKAPEVARALGLPWLEAELDHASATLEGAELRLIRHDRLGLPGFDLVIPKDQAEPCAAALRAAVEAAGGCVAGNEAFEALRIARGIPAYGAELSEEVIPQEAYLDESSVHFDKGCYPGQETVAKLHYRGQPPRRLVRWRITGDALPEAGSEVHREGKRVGVLTSVAALPDGQRLGLGFALRASLEDGLAVEIQGPQTAAATLETLRA